MFEKAKKLGYKNAQRFEFDDYLKRENFTSSWVYVMISSSTGDGEFPDNGTSMHRYLMKCNKEKLDMSHVWFTLLGLGSTDYSTFLGVPIFIHKSLTNLGAHFFYKFGKADEATSLEIGIEPWIDGLWDALQEEMKRKVDIDVKNEKFEEEKKFFVGTIVEKEKI